MAKFRKEGGKETPAISTASLPDIVFMLLFFFMVSTTMREVLVMVDNGMPEAKEVTKLEKKSLVSNIFIGKPIDFDREEFFEQLVDLKKTAYEDDPQMKLVVERLVPSYRAEKDCV